MHVCYFTVWSLAYVTRLGVSWDLWGDDTRTIVQGNPQGCEQCTIFLIRAYSPPLRNTCAYLVRCSSASFAITFYSMLETSRVKLRTVCIIVTFSCLATIIIPPLIHLHLSPRNKDIRSVVDHLKNIGISFCCFFLAFRWL